MLRSMTTPIRFFSPSVSLVDRMVFGDGHVDQQVGFQDIAENICSAHALALRDVHLDVLGVAHDDASHRRRPRRLP